MEKENSYANDVVFKRIVSEYMKTDPQKADIVEFGLLKGLLAQ